MTKIYEIIETADEAYAKGDFKVARRLSKEALMAPDLPKELEARARRLLGATGVDKMAVAIFALSLGALLFLVFNYLL